MEFSFEQQQIIDGSLLGDGSISPIVKDTWTCYFAKGQKHKEYLDWHMDKLQPFSSSIRPRLQKLGGKYFSQHTFITKKSESFKKLRQKWYPNGKKVVPRDLKLQPLSIAVWFADDGQNYSVIGQAIFHTQGFLLDDREFLIEKLREFGIYSYTNNTRRLYIKGSSYLDLINLVSPFFFWDCFKYKIDSSAYQPSYNKMSEERAVKIFDMYYNDKMKQKEIADVFDVDPSCVSDVLRGVSYAHLNLSRAQPGQKVSGFSGKGVSYDKARKKWRAYLGRKVLGRFNTEEEAVAARAKAVAIMEGADKDD